MRKWTSFSIWLLLCGLFLSLLLYFRLANGKPESFLIFQQQQIFPLAALNLITYLGDGLFAAGLVLYFGLTKHKQRAVQLFLVWIIGAFAVQSLKNTVFDDRSRPAAWFEKHKLPLDIPEGYDPHRTHSFPSGHTATAFGIWGMFAYQSKRRILGFAFALLTVFAAWSRIALFQHFPADVVAGGLIGTCSIFAALWLSHKLEAKFPHLFANR